MPHFMCSIPSARWAPSSRSRMNCTRPQTNMKTPAAKTTRISGLMMRFMNLLKSCSVACMKCYNPRTRAPDALLICSIQTAATTGVLYAFRRGDGRCILDTDGALDEPDEAPDGDHYEDGNKAPEHYFQPLVGVLLIHAPEVLDESPEENHDSQRDEKTDDRVEEQANLRKGIKEIGRRGEGGKGERPEGKRGQSSDF